MDKPVAFSGYTPQTVHKPQKRKERSSSLPDISKPTTSTKLSQQRAPLQRKKSSQLAPKSGQTRYRPLPMRIISDTSSSSSSIQSSTPNPIPAPAPTTVAAALQQHGISIDTFLSESPAAFRSAFNYAADLLAFAKQIPSSGSSGSSSSTSS
jgi:hypothetical protein